MRIYKISVILVFVTLIALLYVHQQVQLLKISYTININEKKLMTLLDQNRSLVYNIAKLKSPVNLEKTFLATKKDFRVPQQWQVVEAVVPAQNRQPVLLADSKEQTTGFFNKIFGRPSEAFAKTIK